MNAAWKVKPRRKRIRLIADVGRAAVQLWFPPLLPVFTVYIARYRGRRSRGGGAPRNPYRLPRGCRVRRRSSWCSGANQCFNTHSRTLLVFVSNRRRVCSGIADERRCVRLSIRTTQSIKYGANEVQDVGALLHWSSSPNSHKAFRVEVTCSGLPRSHTQLVHH